MAVQAVFKNGERFFLAPVEVSLLRGLPSLHIIGMPQGLARESLPKLKAAFRAQDWLWPRSKQIVVQIRAGDGEPVGIDLALAAAIALASGQLPSLTHEVFSGDVALNGEVSVPKELGELEDEQISTQVVTGLGCLGFGMKNLSEINFAQPQHEPKTFIPAVRPPLSTRSFTKIQAQLLKVLALGEHPTFIAGPQGSGKTTLVQALLPLLSEPENWRELERFHRSIGEEVTWRPLIAPHHSSGALALLGGGQPPSPGEISKAHGGILFLDEYLEFPSRVQEALREPVERGFIRIARGPRAEVFPAKLILIAASNLCICGKLVPDRGAHVCQHSLLRCRTRIDRLSGPMLDRFHILTLSHEWRGNRSESIEDTYAHICRAREWRQSQGFSSTAAEIGVETLNLRLPPLAKEVLEDEVESERRMISALRVASTLADLDQSTLIGLHHVAQAKKLCVTPFLELGQIFA